MYFEKLLEDDTKLVTNNVAIDETVSYLRNEFGVEKARKFINIIDESTLTINLRMDWISRRVRKNAINNYLKSKVNELQLRHFLINETLKRKSVDVVFSFDQGFKYFNLPLMPQVV
jgi:predicted nucleic acid-binding protein